MSETLTTAKLKDALARMPARNFPKRFIAVWGDPRVQPGSCLAVSLDTWVVHPQDAHAIERNLTPEDSYWRRIFGIQVIYWPERAGDADWEWLKMLDPIAHEWLARAAREQNDG